MKGTLTLAGALLLVDASRADAATFPPGLVYTGSAPGRWAGKERLHVPVVTLEGGKLKIATPHPMSAEHFIVKHTLLTPEGKVLGEKTFTPMDVPESICELPAGFAGAVWATSFCNQHDLWLAEFTV